MFSSVARAGKTSVKSKAVDRPQSAASPMFNSSGSAATKKLKRRKPASSKNRKVTVRRAVRKREIRVTRRKARATHKAAKGRAKRVEANELSSADTAS